MARRNFPPLPEFGDEKAHTLDQAELSAMLRNVAYAQSADETRYILNGVYFNFRDGKLSLVATDGRRLAVVAKEMDIAGTAAGAIILPAKTVAELSRLLDKGEKVKINFNDRRCAFQIGTDKDQSGLIDSVYLYSKVVEGNYPNYQQVVPKETHQRIKLERELFLQCIHRAALVCSEKSNSIRIKLTSNLLEIHRPEPGFRRSPRVDGDRLQRPGPARSRSTRPSSWTRCGPRPRTRSFSSSRTTSAPGCSRPWTASSA